MPDSSAIRTALWRALHAQTESPVILDDQVGLALADPPSDWKSRPDMHPIGTRGYRASIVGRARYVEDLVLERLAQGVDQYVILGAGLDTFAQRRGGLRIFEIDQPETQAWKKGRLEALGLPAPIFVPVDFEKGQRWPEELVAAGFDLARPATLSSTGVSMYLSREANEANLREIARFAPGTVLAMTFLLPLHMLPPEMRPIHEKVFENARQAGTPFLSFFEPGEILELARRAGFRSVKHVGRAELIDRYFRGRADGLVPAEGEEFLVAGV